MANIVEELQADAVDQSISVSSLLRKVKYVAAKLELEETTDWVDHELRGYKDEVPEYRMITGTPKAFSPYHGDQSIGGKSEMVDALSKRAVGQPISGIEDLLAGDQQSGFKMPYSGTITEQLLEGNLGWTEAFLDVPRSALVSIVDQVRTIVLDWALELEKRGITGEGRSFTEMEKEAATQPGVSIQNFYGQMSTGNVEGPNSRINLGSIDQSRNKVEAEQLFQRVENAVRESNVGAEERAQMLAAIDEMRSGHANGGFAEAYANFASLTANHMTILGPFLPALAGLLLG